MTVPMFEIIFVNGLAFFLLGTVIFLLRRRGGAVGIEKSLWLLGGFGLFYGAGEWLAMFAELGESDGTSRGGDRLRTLSYYFSAGAYVLLCQFGLNSVLGDRFRRLPWVVATSSVVFVVTASVGGISATDEVFTRYFLAFPAAAITALAFVQHSVATGGGQHHGPMFHRNMLGAGVAFSVYSVVVGLVVPEASFFPASIFNQVTFAGVAGIPVEAFRAVCGLAAGCFVLGILNIRDAKPHRNPATANDEPKLSHEPFEARLAEQAAQLVRAHAALVELQEAADTATQAKQEQVEELEHLYRSAPVGLELLDRNFRVLRVNERLAALNGKPVHEHIGRTLREIVPQFAAEIEAIVAQVFATGEAVSNIEVHGVTPTDPGNERDWLVSYSPIKSPDGIARYVGCVVSEITELKKVEVELRRQKELLDTVINHIPSAVFWKDRQSVHMGGNQLAATDLGFSSPAEMIGKNNFDLMITPSEAESYTQYDRRVMETGIGLINFEEVLTKPDGRRLDVLTSKVPLRSVQGEVFGVLVIYHDITSRKQAEELLRGNEARIRNQQAALVALTRTEVQRNDGETVNLHAITETSARTLGADRVSVWRYDKDRLAIRCVDLYESSTGKHSDGAELRVTAFPAYFEALETLDVLDAGDANSDQRTREFSESYLKPLGIGAILDAPIHLAGRLEGVMCHEYFGPARRSTADERSFAVAIANIVSLAIEVEERRRVEKELRTKTAFLQAQTESTLDGLLVVDDKKNKVLQNKQFAAIWKLPPHILDQNHDEATLKFVENSLKDSEGFIDRVRQLYAHPTETSREEIELRDGRTLDRFSAPVIGVDGHYYGRFWTFRDITDRKLAEKALAERAELAESESRLDELANAMPQMVWTARPDGYLDYYNDRWYEYTGQPRGVGGDDSWKYVLHPDDLQHCLVTWYEAVHTGNNYEIEYRFRNAKTGQYRWQLGRAMPVRGDGGQIVRWIGTCTDIDDQKQAEASLQRREEQFHTLGNAIPQLAWMARPDGHTFWCNKRWCDYTGTTLAQVEGWGWQSVLDPEELPNVLVRWKASIATGQPFDMVIPFRGADGQFRSFLTRIAPYHGPDGRLLQWFGTATDITERILMEESLRTAHEELEERVQQRTVELFRATEELRQNETRYRSLVEATTAVVWSTAASGEVESDQPGWAAFTGQALEDIRGRVWLDAVHPDDRAQTTRAWTGAFARRSLYRVEHRVRRHDGEYRHMVACAVPIMDSAGAILEWVGVHTDITNEKRAEAALRQAKEAAEAANTQLDALATIDSLTGIANRRGFQARLETECLRAARYPAPLALIMLDLDHFKHLNDNYGHPVGDEVLTIMGRLLAACSRGTDLVARYGGEEFAVILVNTDKSTAKEAAERLRARIESEPWPHGAVTASIGIASWGPRANSASELLRQADQALYYSKNHGRNLATHYLDINMRIGSLRPG